MVYYTLYLRSQSSEIVLQVRIHKKLTFLEGA